MSMLLAMIIWARIPPAMAIACPRSPAAAPTLKYLFVSPV